MAMVLLLAASTSAHGAANAGQIPGVRSGILVSGSVTGAEGSPLSMVRVDLDPTMGGFASTTYTDSSGEFSFSHVQPGSYTVVIKSSGYQTGTWPLEVGYANLLGLTFSLIPSASRSGGKGAARKDSNTVSVRQLLVPGKARKEFQKGVQSELHGKTDEAIKQWNKAIKIYPQYADSYMQLSRVYAIRGDFAQATTAAQRAIAIDGNRANAYDYLAYVYLKEQDFANAQAAFEHAARLSNSDWFSQFWLGQLLMRRKNAQGAFPYLRRASQLNPGMPEVYILLYNDLLMLGRRKDALADLDDFLKRFPKSPLAGEVREKRKDLAKDLTAGAN
jgi:tetratricopeptide (TPR) repeat protein